jgi:hypothetical protein
METVKLVNRAFAGEEEILCFQNPETLKIYEFSEIQKTYINSEIRDFEEDDWKLVLNNENHLAAIDLISGGFVTLHV